MANPKGKLVENDTYNHPYVKFGHVCMWKRGYLKQIGKLVFFKYYPIETLCKHFTCITLENKSLT